MRRLTLSQKTPSQALTFFTEHFTEHLNSANRGFGNGGMVLTGKELLMTQ